MSLCSAVEVYVCLSGKYCVHLQGCPCPSPERGGGGVLKMEAVCFSEMFVNFYQVTCCHNEEDSTLLSHCCKNLRFHTETGFHFMHFVQFLLNVHQIYKSIIKGISIALFVCQVVTLAVYSYFITCVMGRQWVEGVDENLQKHRNKIDLYFPIFTTLQVRIILNLYKLEGKMQGAPKISLYG
jgi:hypothetical protein